MDLICELRRVQEELTEMKKQVKELQEKTAELEKNIATKNIPPLQRSETINRVQPLLAQAAAAPPALRPMKSMSKPRPSEPITQSPFERMRSRK